MVELERQELEVLGKAKEGDGIVPDWVRVLSRFWACIGFDSPGTHYDRL